MSVAKTKSTKAVAVKKAARTTSKGASANTAAAIHVHSGGILTIGRTKPENSMTPVEKMERARAGITKQELERLKERTKLDYDKLAHLLSVTRATLINKAKTAAFAPTLSERIVGLADLYAYGYEVFENEDAFNRWMFEANRALGGLQPYDICDSAFGREEVRNILGRMDYGVHS